MNTLQNTDSYRQVMAWLRGGDIAPDTHIEEQFRMMITEIVMQCIVANRDEIRWQCTAADRRERRDRMQPSPLSIRAVMAQCGAEYDPVTFRAVSKPEDLPSETDDIGDLPEGNPEVTVQPVRYDSFSFAKALVHMAQMEGRGLNMSQIQAILYIS